VSAAPGVGAAPPLVSVIIPVYDGEAFVERSVASALAQPHVAVEVVVVNDGSRDRTPALVDAMAERDARVRPIHQANRGLSGARNAGIAAARGAFINFLDADDLLLPHKLALQLPAFDDDPDVGLVYSDYQTFDGATGAVWDVPRGEPPMPIEVVLDYRNWFAPMVPLLRRELVDRVGGFDPSFRAVEDWDYWIRCLAHARFRYVPGAVARYRLHGGQMHRDRPRMAEAHAQLDAKHFAASPERHRRFEAFRHVDEAQARRAAGDPWGALTSAAAGALAARTPTEFLRVVRLARLHATATGQTEDLHA